eukprot:TRINITY_DN18689_c0_g1_i1.p1 TRINITY_DN18689_c0_g1~~TRINITY_DN18689_c0_g1_i1.p1  ORF type:complete len:134 (+),score=28.97 TRINITY_DN18689_c0_g1_i1:186-587(+)
MAEEVEHLMNQYTACSQVLTHGTVPPKADSMRLEKDARAVLAKLQSHMETIPKGHVGRVPLVVLHTFASRVLIDAWDMQSLKDPSPADNHSSLREETLSKAMTMVKEEVRDMLAACNLTLYTCGIILAHALAM